MATLLAQGPRPGVGASPDQTRAVNGLILQPTLAPRPAYQKIWHRGQRKGWKRAPGAGLCRQTPANLQHSTKQANTRGADLGLHIDLLLRRPGPFDGL